MKWADRKKYKNICWIFYRKQVALVPGMPNSPAIVPFFFRCLRCGDCQRAPRVPEVSCSWRTQAETTGASVLPRHSPPPPMVSAPLSKSVLNDPSWTGVIVSFWVHAHRLVPHKGTSSETQGQIVGWAGNWGEPPPPPFSARPSFPPTPWSAPGSLRMTRAQTTLHIYLPRQRRTSATQANVNQGVEAEKE